MQELPNHFTVNDHFQKLLYLRPAPTLKENVVALKAMRGLRWQLAWRRKTSRTWARTLQHPHRQSRAAYIAARQAARLGLLIKIDAYIEQLHAIAMRGSEAEPVATNYGFDQN